MNHLNDKSQLLSAMANPLRLRALILLHQKEMNVTELCVRLNVNQSALSQHLAKLRLVGLVTTRRASQEIYYTCGDPTVKTIIATLERLFK